MENKINPDTGIGRVSLTVADLGRAVDFYQDRLGFKETSRDDGKVMLNAGKGDLLRLVEQKGAQPTRGTTGLYHFAILVPSRFALAKSLRRLSETQTAVQGFSDHGVSEAIYLSDPDGNGIEIYRDRPRDQWPLRNGSLAMVSDPLDLDGILGELEDKDAHWNGLDVETIIGHVHLHVANISESEKFYCGVIGLDLMQRFGGAASFLSAGGYHHHVGINVWAGIGAPAPPPTAAGLRWFELRLPDAESMEALLKRLKAANNKPKDHPFGLLVRDPSQNPILLTVNGGS